MSNKESTKKEEVTLETIKEETKTKKFTKEELMAKVRAANMNYEGRIYVDEKYKKPDKVLRIDNGDAATRHYMKSLGYTIVQRQEDAKTGSGSLREPSSMGSEVEFELAIYGQSQPAIAYEIDKDLYEARQEVEAEMSKQKFHNTVDDLSFEGMTKPK